MAMIKSSANVRGILTILLLLLVACSRDISTAQGVAEEFVDQHYVVMDLQRAKALAVSVALEKVNDEIRLTTGQAIDAATQKPRVNYTLVEKKESDRRASFLFEGTIRSDDNTTFTRHWRITARKEGEQWRVSNFTESE
jgi:hypothetical protein